MVDKESKETPNDEPVYERPHFFRDLAKVARRLRPDEAEKKKPKGRRPGGRSPGTT